MSANPTAAPNAVAPALIPPQVRKALPCLRWAVNLLFLAGFCGILMIVSPFLAIGARPYIDPTSSGLLGLMTGGGLLGLWGILLLGAILMLLASDVLGIVGLVLCQGKLPTPKANQLLLAALILFALTTGVLGTSFFIIFEVLLVFGPFLRLASLFCLVLGLESVPAAAGKAGSAAVDKLHKQSLGVRVGLIVVGAMYAIAMAGTIGALLGADLAGGSPLLMVSGVMYLILPLVAILVLFRFVRLLISLERWGKKLPV